MVWDFFRSKTRKIEPKHKLWIPHGYQDRAVDHLLDTAAALLVLDPGLGKTSIALEAFMVLQREGMAKQMLVIAPMRVCQLVWRQEAAKWTQFTELKFSFLHGSKKKRMLGDDSDIHLINPEGVAWLMKQFPGKELPYEVVCIDEITKFKNGMSVRHKALRPPKGKDPLAKVPWVWGMTGSLIPNGYMDLFGQIRTLDGGAALGRYFTHFRNKYFEKDYTGFGYTLRRGASREIEKAIEPYVLRMSAEDYLDMPPLVKDIISLELPPKVRKVYQKLKKNLIADLDGVKLEAGNTAAVYSKLKQMANGAVYAGDGVFEPRRVIHLHDVKIDAIRDLIEDLQGAPLLVGYEFKHDLARLKAAFGEDTPYIGSGVSEKQAAKIERDWNANKIPLLFAHPASAGHGLNFQIGNACHVAWFSCTWDFELYDQFIRRLWRQGNKSTTVFVHLLIVENTIDNKTLAATTDKGLTQKGLYDALKAEIYLDGKSETSQTEEDVDFNNEVDKILGEDEMRKLKRKGKVAKDQVEDDQVEVDEEEAEEEEAPKRKRRGSKRKAKVEEPVEADEDEDDDDEEEEAPKRRRSSKSTSKRKLRGKKAEPEDEDDGDDDDDEDDEPVKKKSRGKFSKAVQEQIDGDDDEDDDEESDNSDPSEVDYDKLACAIVDQLVKRFTD